MLLLFVWRPPPSWPFSPTLGPSSFLFYIACVPSRRPWSADWWLLCVDFALATKLLVLGTVEAQKLELTTYILEGSVSYTQKAQASEGRCKQRSLPPWIKSIQIVPHGT